ncbi:dihydroxyacetone kinase subunit DhaK [Paenibacillus piri]|uniref:Dihydroxyacetone kinase subunit DhaK n=1 Tax=Paenibacillus piri TaxID=2547395 RepID=A0A4R5KFG0_9BACL|nr:dihydroxyacetone kinase subunit DhaK [Paenibacillus piri]TDF94159.1 dihydroxyacetone kinase subunit DhaK [Paenibacillus piri]
MKMLINEPNQVVDEMLEGYAAAFPRHVTILPQNKRSLVRAGAMRPGKVGIVTGGGSGHEPAFMGLIGKGMADGVAVGNVFASPPPDPILEATRAVHGGAGILYLYTNYAGDCMNFDMAAELAGLENIRVATVRVTDDVASAPKEQPDKRRGIAGSFFVYKAAGAAADQYLPLEEVVRVAEKAKDSVRTMGVALSPCYMPQTGQPSFVLDEDEMEIGLGIHGEPGVRRGKLGTADEVSAILFQSVLDDMPLQAGDRAAVLVNGMGATPLMQLFIVYRNIAGLLESQGIQVHQSFVGEYVTSLEMGGCSVSIMKLDDELAGLIDHPAETAFFAHRQGDAS